MTFGEAEYVANCLARRELDPEMRETLCLLAACVRAGIGEAVCFIDELQFDPRWELFPDEML